MRYAAANKSLALTAKLKQGFVNKVKFQILDASGAQVHESPEKDLVDGKAAWEWTPNTEEFKALADTDDFVEVSVRVFWLNPDGSGSGGYIYLDQVTVFRDQITVKISDEQGQAVKSALVRLVVHRPGVLTPSQKTPEAPANDQGEVTFKDLEYWTSITVVVSGAWVLKTATAPWTTGKEKGLNREVVVVPKTYKAMFKEIARSGETEFAPIPEIGGKRIQFVNFDKEQAAPHPLPQGDAKQYYGHLIDLKVGPMETPKEFAGYPIFVKFEAATTNGRRNHPKPALSGQGKEADATGVLELRLDADGTAICTVELGYAGGDLFTLKICSHKDLSGTVDETLQIESWRKLFYELIAPNAMTPALDGDDFVADVRDRIKKVLDPVFVKYERSKAHVFGDDAVQVRSQLQAPAFFGRTDPRPLYLGSSYTREPKGKSLTSQAHTVLIYLFDYLFDAKFRPALQQPVMKTLEQEIPASGGLRGFLNDLEAALPAWVGAGVKHLVNNNQIRWEAVVTDPAIYQNRHPGLDPQGKPLAGTLHHSCVSAITHTKVKITLPTNAPPGTIVGEESAEKCPIKVTLTLNEVEPFAGGYSMGIQPTYYLARTDIFAHTLCHELGHAMGMTPIDQPPPPGLDAPKSVDDGGTYFCDLKYKRQHTSGYDETKGGGGVRTPGVGPHCAEGVSSKTDPEYSDTIPDSGCVMYWIVPKLGSAERESPFLFCAACTEFIKAQPLTSLSL